MGRDFSLPTSPAPYVPHSSKLSAPSDPLPVPFARPLFSITSNNQFRNSFVLFTIQNAPGVYPLQAQITER